MIKFFCAFPTTFFAAVKYSDLQCKEKMGESGLGSAHKGLWKRKGMTVTIKVVANQLDPKEVG